MKAASIESLSCVKNGGVHAVRYTTFNANSTIKTDSVFKYDDPAYLVKEAILLRWLRGTVNVPEFVRLVDTLKVDGRLFGWALETRYIRRWDGSDGADVDVVNVGVPDANELARARRAHDRRVGPREFEARLFENLANANAIGLMHGNLSTDHVVMDKNGVVYLTNWKLATCVPQNPRVPGDGKVANGNNRTTRGYRPPEERTDERGDVWSAALVAFEYERDVPLHHRYYPTASRVLMSEAAGSAIAHAICPLETRHTAAQVLARLTNNVRMTYVPPYRVRYPRRYDVWHSMHLSADDVKALAWALLMASSVPDEQYDVVADVVSALTKGTMLILDDDVATFATTVDPRSFVVNIEDPEFTVRSLSSGGTEWR